MILAVTAQAFDNALALALAVVVAVYLVVVLVRPDRF